MAARLRITGPGLLILVLGAVAGVAALLGVFKNRSPEAPPQPPPDNLTLDDPVPDPRLTFATPFRNVKPEVHYVGDASCVNCHKSISEKFHAHPMGRSAEMSARATPLEGYDAKANTPFQLGPYTLRVEKTGDKMVHRIGAKDSIGATLPDYVQTADIAIGSGTRGRSYLAIHQGAVWQTPISWFSSNEKWDLSPGFNLGNGGRRAILPECLFCHVDRVEPIPGALNRYREPLFPTQVAIGCERCHGPGELHVAERLPGGPTPNPDTSIVNPKHLPPALQLAVCEQCHLQGQERVTRRGRDAFEFRPGLPFEQFVTVFIRHPDLADLRRSVGQFEQMELSRCFTASGRMVCTSCHDPHTTPTAANRDAFYRAKCLTCHESRGCSLPAPARQEKNDNCTACHMQRNDSSNIVHASVTDHRILRQPVKPTSPRPLPPDATPMVAFRSGPNSPPAAERDRALGIALARVSRTLPAGTPMRGVLSELAQNRLDTSLKKWRGDPDAWTELSSLMLRPGDENERLQAAEKAVRLAPNSEVALAELADAAMAAERLEEAEDAATKLIAKNPSGIEPYLIRAALYSHKKEWENAEADCRAALRIHPLHPRARLLLGICRHHRGDPNDGRREAETAISLVMNPQQQAMIRDLYQRETR